MKKNKREIEEIKKRGQTNGLSPRQIKKLIKINEDFELLNDDIEKLMLEPDVKEILKEMMPEKRKVNKNTVDPDDILMATIVGDIIGSFREFTQYDFANIKNEELFTDKNFYTDDTVLSIATKQAVLKNPKNPDFRSAYIEAYKKEPDAGYGGNFISWVEGFAIVYEDGEEKKIEIDNTKGYGSMANGSAMRISYIPAYYDNVKDVIKHTFNSSIVSHNHYEGVKGAVVFSVCIWMALHGYSKEDIYNYCKKHYKYTDEEKQYLINNWCLFDIDTALPKFSNKVSKNSLFCNYAVPFVIKCFYDTDDYDSCIRKTLSHFGDADTLCAMASGLCYAFYKEIPYNIGEIKEKYLKGLKI